MAAYTADMEKQKGMLERAKARKRVGMQTIHDDINSMNASLGEMFSGWQSGERMAEAKSSLGAMLPRLTGYRDYVNRYQREFSGLDLDRFNRDMDDLIGYYSDAYGQWDDVTKAYAGYQNADAYSKAVKRYQWGKENAGLTAQEVQERLRDDSVTEEEKGYLRNYGVDVGYASLADYDADLEYQKGRLDGMDPGDPFWTTILKKVAGKDEEREAQQEQLSYVEQLTAARNRYDIENRFSQYSDRMGNADFVEKSQYVLGGSENYEYANDMDGARGRIKNNYIFNRHQDAPQWELGLDEMTGDERAVYNYIYATEGEGAADEYLERMSLSWNKRRSDRNAGRVEEIADDSAFLSGLMSVAAVPAGMVGGIKSTVQTLRDKIKGKETNPYAPAYDLTNFSANVRDAVGSNIEEGTDWEIGGVNVARFAYDTGLSMVESAVGAATFGKSFTLVMGMSAASQKMKELKDAGAAENEVILGSAAAGIAEALFEKVSLDNLLTPKSADSFRSWVKETAKQAGIEASEEVFTEIANTISDSIIRSGTSELAQTYRDYMEQGYSEGEAKRQVFAGVLKNIAVAGAGGAVSGGILGGLSGARNYHNLSRTGNVLKGNQTAGNLLGIASGLNGDGEAYHKYQELKGSNVSAIAPAKLGNLYQMAGEELSQGYHDAVGDYANGKGKAEKVVHAGERWGQFRDLTSQVSTDTKGNVITVKGVDAETGKVKTDRGFKEAQELNLSDTDARLAEAAEFLGEAGDELFGQYARTQDVDAYVDAFQLVERYGEYGLGTENVLKNRGILTEAQALAAYRAGVQVRQENLVKKLQEQVDAATKEHFGKDVDFRQGNFDDSAVDYKKLSRRQRRAVGFTKVFSQATGANIEFYESSADENGHRTEANGWYDRKTNTIHLDVNAGLDTGVMEDAIIPTLSHELTHWMKEKSPVLYEKLAEGVMDALTADGSRNIEGMLGVEQERYQALHREEMSLEGARDELVARACEDMLAGSEYAKRLVDSLGEQGKKSLAEKVKEVISNLLEWVSELLGLYESRSEEAGILRGYGEKLGELGKVWDQMLHGAVVANQALGQGKVEGGEVAPVQRSERGNDPGRKFGQQLQEWMQGKMPEKGYFELGRTSDILVQVGAKGLPLIMKGDSVLKFTSNYKNHAIAIDEAAKLPNELENPVFILKGSMENSIVAVTELEDKAGLEVIAAIHLNQWFGRLNVNRIASIYGKNNISSYVEKQISLGNLLYYDKKRSKGWFTSKGLQLPNLVQTNTKASNKSISQKMKNAIPKNEDFFAEKTEKNRSLAAPIDEQAPIYTPKAASSTASDLSISQNPENAIPKITQDTKKESPITQPHQTDRRPEIEDSGFTIQQSSDDVNKIFSDRATSTVYDLTGEREMLQQENAKLRADVENLKELLGMEEGTKKVTWYTQEQLKERAKFILKQTERLYGKNCCNYDAATLAVELEELYTEISNGENMEWDVIMNKAYSIAEGIADNMKAHKVVDDHFKEVLKTIRTDRISLNEGQMAEAVNRFGSKGAFHKAVFGRIMVAADGVALDQKWQQWAAQYPDLFDAGISDADQITALLDIYATCREASEVWQQYDRTEVARALATEIYHQYWQMTPMHFEGKEFKNRAAQLKYEHRQMMEQMRRQYEMRQESAVARQKAQDKEKYRKSISDYRDMLNRKDEIHRITKQATTMAGWLKKNTPKEHVPEIMKETLANFLSALDFSSKQLLGIRKGKNAGLPTRRDVTIAQAMQGVADMVKAIDDARGSEPGAEYTVQPLEGKYQELYGKYVDLPQGFSGHVMKFAGQVNQLMLEYGDGVKVLNAMTLEELKELKEIVTTLRTTITNMNRFFANARFKSAVDASRSTITELERLGEKGKRTGAATDFFRWNNTLPYYAFKRYGSGGQAIFEGFQDGWDRFAFSVKDIIGFTEGTYRAEDARAWSRDVREVMVGSRTVKMTVAQIMSLYCLSKRQQAVRHLVGGGMRIADFDAGGKTGKVSQTRGVNVTMDTVRGIVQENLTDEQIRVADALQEFMGTTCAGWGNEVSMRRFGYKAFGEENYFPIQTDKDSMPGAVQTDQENSLYRLLNMSFTKSLTKGADNTIVISDIFDVFAQHSTDMAKYNALALPILDAIKWYNYVERFDLKKDGVEVVEGEEVKPHRTESVQEILNRVYGNGAKKYFTDFLKDLNGSQEGGRGEEWAHRMMSKYKMAAVGANIRVALLQPTAYARAGAVLDGKYLRKAFAHKPQMALAEKYCGIALWKSLGFYDTSISRSVRAMIKHEETWKDKVAEASMKGAEMGDKVTWGYLWNACEMETLDQRGDLVRGSDAFYQAVAKRLREVIYRTQVVDSSMTRTQMMRSRSAWTQMATAFMSEPSLSYNLLFDVYADFEETCRTGNKGEAMRRHGAKLARVMFVSALTSAFGAVAGALWDVWRRPEEDEEFAKQLLATTWENFLGDVSVIGKLPVLKDMYSVFEGWDISRMDTEVFAQANEVRKQLVKLTEGKGDAYKLAYSSVKAASYATGLPGGNAMREVVAIWNHTFGEWLDKKIE
ncbi:MAG: hypothetical protein K2P87_16460 [Lachnospiraceae bacterium]|nr:hypothetical protein [Lachnospiraceae bacterium]